MITTAATATTATTANTATTTANTNGTARARSPEFDEAVLALREGLLIRAFHLELSPAAAHDLVQDTLERALRCSGRFQWGTNLRAWVQTLMFNIFVDRYRQRSHETSLERLMDDSAMPEPEQEPEWRRIDPAVLLDALSRLPPALRGAFELRFDLGLSYTDIARRLAIPVGTVGTRLLRARRQLRRLLAAQLARPEAPAARAGRFRPSSPAGRTQPSTREVASLAR